MAAVYPITEQITSFGPRSSQATSDICIADVEDCLVYNRHGVCTTFKSLFHNKKAIIIFVRNFLCYTCKEYVEDLSKIPQELLLDAGVRLIVIGQSSYSHIEPFCTLTNYQYEIYVDPEKQIYKKLGMARGETFMEKASKSPHVKSSVLGGHMKSMWRAMISPAFDFQGDPLQQGGAFIIGPGPNVHLTHFDVNRFDHAPISWLLQLAGIQAVDFKGNAKIIDI